jgi:ABC-type Fe3+/spermidine/putrescine transport system ATPase subunit
MALVVRPEHVRLAERREPGRGFLQASVRQVVYLGPYIKYELEAADEILYARREIYGNEQPYRAGDALEVDWRREDSLLVLPE